jgi:hypothetical protein
MTPTGCPSTTGARSPRVAPRWFWFALTAAPFALAVSGLLAGDRAAPAPIISTTSAEGGAAPKLAIAPPTPAPSVRDMRLAVHVRGALLEDSELAPFNVGVKVRDGVAVLWGPLPSVELQQRALKRAEEVQGVLGVRSEMHVAAVKPAEEARRAPGSDEVIRSTSASPGSLGTLTGRTQGMLVPSTSAHAADPPEPAEPSPSPVVLLAPVAVTPPTEAVPAAVNDDELAASIQKLRRGNERYLLIQTERKGSVVVVRGGEAPGEDVMAFARALANLPGVERVVLRGDP